MSLRQLLIGMMAVILVGCHALPTTAPLGKAGAVGEPTLGTSATIAEGQLSGRVDFPPSREAQALPGDVIIGATISFLDAAGATLATGKTDGAGNFTLSLGGFTPVNGTTYLLEAIKGLGGNTPGSNAVRLRTILQWNGTGWLSCTNSAVSGTIVINALTTALAIESALDPTRVPAAQTIGKVNATASPATFNAAPGPYTNHPDAELIQLTNDLLASLGGNADPVASVPAIKPTITGVSPSSGPVNALVQITGTGFNPVPAGNTVTINGAAAGIVLATPTSLVVTVGAGAGAAGNVTVTTARGTATGGSFTLLAGGGTTFWIDGFSPESGRPGTTFTLKGQFATIGSTPSVRFTGIGGMDAFATVTSFDATTITAKVPLGALPGRVLVQANGLTSTSGPIFDVWQGDLSTMTTLSNPTPSTGTLHFIGDTWAGRYATARYAQYQYHVAWKYVWMTPLLQNGGIGAPRIAGKLGLPRNWASMVIYGRYMYVIGGDNGGACSIIERATINDDGSLSAFKAIANLATPRFLGGSVVIGGTIYVLPGAWTGNIERWNIDSTTGNLSYVGSYSQPYFGQPTIDGYYGYSYACWGNWIVFFGGHYIPNVGHTNLGFALNIRGDGSISPPYPAPALPIRLYQSASVMANVGSNNGSTTDIFILGGYRPELDNWNNSRVFRATWDWRRDGGAGTGFVTDFVEVTPLLNNQTPGYVFCNGKTLHAIGGTNSNYIQSATLTGSNLGAWSYVQGTNCHGAAPILLGNKAWTIGGDVQGNDANGNAVNAPTATTRYVSINADGTLSAGGTGPSLNTARGHAPAVTARGYVYVLGGGDWNNGTLSSIERAPVNPDGTLGAFITLPQTLSGPRWTHNAFVYNNALYSYGGLAYTAGTTPYVTYDTIDRFPVNADGSLGTRQVLSTYLPEPMRGAAPVVVGDSVYLVGGVTKYGYDGGNYPGASTHVVRATFNPDGSLSQFQEAAPLPMPIAFAQAALIGNYLYTFGGGQGEYSSDVLRAAVRPDGSLMPWEVYQNGGSTPVMSSPTYAEWGPPLIFNNFLYIPDTYDTVSPGRNMSCGFAFGTIR